MFVTIYESKDSRIYVCSQFNNQNLCGAPEALLLCSPIAEKIKHTSSVMRIWAIKMMQIISDTVCAGNVENWRVHYCICGGPVPELGPLGPPSLGYVIRSLVEHGQGLQRWLSSLLPHVCNICIYPQT